MNKIRTILLALLLSVATTPLMADFTGPYVGVTLAANGAVLGLEDLHGALRRHF